MRTTFFKTVLMVVVLSLVAGCGDDASDTDAGMDGSTDTDTDSDTDTDTDTDTDSDTDSDSDADSGVGDDCTAEFSSMMASSLPGVCAAAVGDCTAGTAPEDAQGTCNDGLTCCLNDDACVSSGMGMTSCEADGCTLGSGLQGGCPDGGWCCAAVDVITPDAGTAGDGEDCSVTVEAGGGAYSFAIAGTCAAEESTCAGGYMEGFEAGDCIDGFWCCIGTDQCEAIGGGDIMTCQADPCSTFFGFQNGCPDNGYCCSPFKK